MSAPPSPTCPDGRCDGSGFLYDEVRRIARPCSCRPARLARRRAAALEARIPNRYRGVSFDREPVPSIERANPHVVREVRSYVRELEDNLADGRGLLFAGDVGTGKTTLAMLVSKAAIEARHTVAIYSLPRLLAVLRESFGDDAEHRLTHLIDALCSVDLLHIDDVGAEQTSPWVLEQLYTIVNTRYEDRRSIIVTTNLILPGDARPPGRISAAVGTGERARRYQPLVDQISERTVSRLTEMCGEPLEMYGEDRRSEIPIPEIAPVAYRDAPEWDEPEPAYGEPRPRRPRFAS